MADLREVQAACRYDTEMRNNEKQRWDGVNTAVWNDEVLNLGEAVSGYSLNAFTHESIGLGIYRVDVEHDLQATVVRK